MPLVVSNVLKVVIYVAPHFLQPSHINRYLHCPSLLHLVHVAVLAPPPHRLSVIVEDDTASREERNQRHIRHDRWDESARDPVSKILSPSYHGKTNDLPNLLAPRRDKLAEPVTPKIFVHRYADEQASRNGLVAIDSVGADYRRERSDLDAGTGVSHYHNCLPWKLVVATL